MIAALAAALIALGHYGGPTNGLERDVMRGVRELRAAAPWLSQPAMVLTALGGIQFVFGISGIAATYLWLSRQRERAGLLLATVLVERLTVDGLKLAFGRARPEFDPLVATSSASFPSGHAANSMTAFVAIALLAAPPRHRAKAMIVAASLATLVALTRPYLGVHWPSDMVGGWLVAAGFLLSARLVADRRGLLEEAQHQIVGRHRPPLGQR